MGTVAVCGIYFSKMVTNEYTKDQVLKRMHIEDHPFPQVVHREVPESLKKAPQKPADGKTIQKRGFLRVGYDPEGLPFSFFNSADQLVGYDAA